MAAPPAQTGRNPGCVCSLAGETVIQRQEIVALSNEMGMLCFGQSSDCYLYVCAGKPESTAEK